jgi:catechol 2,3-dioxygenase-like lactoylglutathione lyase family enzyme
MYIDHVVLWVDDASRSLDFYTRVVGLESVRAEEFASGAAPFPSVRVSGARGTSTHWFYFQDPDGNVIEARHYGE